MQSVMKTLGENLKRMLQERGITQKELSRLTRGAVSQATISGIKHGKPTANDMIEAIAKALDVEPWRLLVDPESDAARLYDAYTGADPSGREFIQQVIERELAASKNR